jgi:hypothetical protein
MLSELLAYLRGILGNAVHDISNPMILFWLLLGIYILWRRTSRT